MKRFPSHISGLRMSFILIGLLVGGVVGGNAHVLVGYSQDTILQQAPAVEAEIVAKDWSFDRQWNEAEVSISEKTILSGVPGEGHMVLFSQPSRGGAVRIVGDNVIYSAPLYLRGTDSFGYLILDGLITVGRGEMVIRVIEPPSKPEIRATKIVILEDGTKRVTFSGEPWGAYVVEFATSLNGPWVSIGASVPSGKGVFQLEYESELSTGFFRCRCDI